MSIEIGGGITVAKSFMHACAGVCLLAISGAVIYGSVVFDGVAESAIALMQQQSERQQKLIASQEELVASAQNASTMIVEVLYAGLARSLEEQGVLSPTDASRIVTEAIDNLTQQSGRMGLIAKAMNDSYLKQKSR